MSDYAHRRAELLNRRYRDAGAEEVLRAAVEREFPTRLALVSSFGAESAVLLHMAAEIDPALEVVFIDTLRLFGETLRYRDTLIARLGLTNVRTVRPKEAAVSVADPKSLLFARNPDQCCFIRKVEPLQRALEGHDAWISGRKRFQSSGRAELPLFEAADGRVKVNPLAHWTRERIEAYFEDHDLPRHPLEKEGYLSIGCMPCTDRVGAGEDARDGRWRGRDKDECGIHVALGAASPIGGAGALQ